MNILFINAYTNVHSLQKVYMGQPYGKTGLPSDWQRNFLHSITSFNLGQSHDICWHKDWSLYNCIIGNRVRSPITFENRFLPY